ncbi:hypothetical protein H5410_060838, partial [Solanum commersonii]
MTRSDHAPLLLSCGVWSKVFSRPFKFLKFWVAGDKFKEVVKLNWTKTEIALSKWSKDQLGRIYKQMLIREEVVRLKEDLFEEFPTIENRPVFLKAYVELKIYLHYEEEFWRQKARMRKRLSLNIIMKDDGSWAKGVANIVEKV